MRRIAIGSRILGHRPSGVVASLVVAASIVCLFGSLVARGGPAPREEKSSDADRSAIESLAREILGRVDATDALRQTLIDVEIASRKAASTAEDAEKDAEVAEIALREYREGTHPQEKQTAAGEIKLAESELERAKDRFAMTEKMFKRGSIAESQLFADRMSQQKAEISLTNAKKMEVLLKYTVERNTTDLEANIRTSQAKMLARRAEAVRAGRLVEATKRLQAEGELSKGEVSAVTALDEAIGLFDSGKAEPARASLARAMKGWRDEQDRRARVKFDEMKLRVRELADRARAGR